MRPAAKLILLAIHGSTGEPNIAGVDAIANPDPRLRYYRMSDAVRLIAVACLEVPHIQLDAGVARLELIAVQPSEQGKGHGRRMLRYVEQQAVALGATTMELFSTVDGEALYTSSGYMLHPTKQSIFRKELPRAAQPSEPANSTVDGSALQEGSVGRVGAEVRAGSAELAGALAIGQSAGSNLERATAIAAGTTHESDNPAAGALYGHLLQAQGALGAFTGHARTAQQAFAGYIEGLGLAPE